MKHDELENMSSDSSVVLQDYLNIKSPALVCIMADVRDIHSAESVRKCGWSICTLHLSHTHIQPASFEQRWDKTCCMCASKHTHAVDYLQHAAESSLARGHVMSSQIISDGYESCPKSITELILLSV